MRLTRRQQDVLLEHLDRPDGVLVLVSAPRRMVALKALMDAGLLYGEGPRPRRTFTTELGRRMICRVLAKTADALTHKQFKKRDGEWTSQRQEATGKWKPKRKPIRDRAAYMRTYKRRRRQAERDFQERVNG